MSGVAPAGPVIPVDRAITATAATAAPPAAARAIFQRDVMSAWTYALARRFPTAGKIDGMTLPLQPPFKPMLAKLTRTIPEGDGWLFEPKWDGFRCVVFRDGDDIELASRNERPFTRYFPELLDPLRASLPDRCVVDGEIVVADREGRGLDFDALLQRIHPAESRVRRLAAETPASYVAFDLLALDDDVLLERPLSERRERAARACCVRIRRST